MIALWKKKTGSISARLIGSLTAVMTLLWLLAVGLGASVMNDELNETFDGTLQDTAERLVPLIVDEFEHHGFPEGVSRSHASRASGYREYLIYQVRDASGRVLIRSHDAPEEPFDAPLKRGFWKNRTYRFFTATDPDTGTFIQVADRFRNRDEAVREGSVALFVPLAFLIPVGAMAVWLVVRRGMRPVDQLRQEIETKNGGNLEAVDGSMLPRELQPIAFSVNRLMGRLRSALDAEREFTSNSAHELRTPIAGALAQTQMLISELKDISNKRRAKQIETSLQRLSRLAEKLLQLSRAEAGIGMADAEADLAQVLEMVLTDFWRGMEEPERLTLHRAPGVKLVGPFSEDAFAIVMRNLIENALVHGEPGGQVEVHLEHGGLVRVANEAAIMSPDELAVIRKRFTRGKTEASGSGLGISIVDRLLGQMNGRLVLSSPAAGHASGFEARVELENSTADKKV